MCILYMYISSGWHLQVHEVYLQEDIGAERDCVSMTALTDLMQA